MSIVFIVISTVLTLLVVIFIVLPLYLVIFRFLCKLYFPILDYMDKHFKL
nr:MAG TPA: hypothetical protein [Caudoviricetes sp.]